jgi:hypothetical protein
MNVTTSRSVSTSSLHCMPILITKRCAHLAAAARRNLRRDRRGVLFPPTPAAQRFISRAAQRRPFPSASRGHHAAPTAAAGVQRDLRAALPSAAAAFRSTARAAATGTAWRRSPSSMSSGKRSITARGFGAVATAARPVAPGAPQHARSWANRLKPFEKIWAAPTYYPLRCVGVLRWGAPAARRWPDQSYHPRGALQVPRREKVRGRCGGDLRGARRPHWHRGHSHGVPSPQRALPRAGEMGGSGGSLEPPGRLSPTSHEDFHEVL